MGWLDDILGNLGKAASNHEELLGAIPLIAGSALLARNGRAGGPIGAGLTALGGLMEAPYFRSQPQGKSSTVQITGPRGNTQYGTRNDLTGQTSWWGTGITPFEKPVAPKMETWFQVDPSSGKVISNKDLPVGSQTPGPNWFSEKAANLNATISSRQAAEDLRKQAMHQSLQEHADARALALQIHNDRPPREPHLQALVDNSGKVTGILNLDTGMTRPVSGPSGFKTPPRNLKGKFQRIGNELDYLDVDANGNPVVKKIKDIPPNVKDKNEYTNFVSDYVSKNPTAGGMEIDKAWEDFKNKAAAARTTATGTAARALPPVSKPWTAKDAAALRASAINQAKTELAAPGGILSFGRPTPPTPAALNKRMTEILRRWGADANGWGPSGKAPTALPTDAAPDGAKVHF